MLAVGGSVRATYANLARRPDALAGVGVSTLDELHPLDRRDPRGFGMRLRQDLGPHASQIDDSATFCSDASDPDEEARRVAAVVASGVLGMAVLGLGRNGHLAFNEPGVPFNAVSRWISLIPDTVAHLGGQAAIAPATGAMTLSLSTLMLAREVLLVVDGDKQWALHGLLWGPLTTDLPASLLRLHPCATVLTTETVVGSGLSALRGLPGVTLTGSPRSG